MQFLWNMTQFGILLTLAIFMFFFVIGYTSKKRSGGFFLIFAGFSFITFAVSANSYLNILITGMLVPFGIFIALLGVKKAFYNEEATEQEQANAQSQAKRRKR